MELIKDKKREFHFTNIIYIFLIIINYFILIWKKISLNT